MLRHQRTHSSGRWWPRRHFVSKTIKFSLLVVFCGTIILNVLFLAETTKHQDTSSTTDNGRRHPRNLRQQVLLCLKYDKNHIFYLHVSDDAFSIFIQNSVTEVTNVDSPEDVINS